MNEITKENYEKKVKSLLTLNMEYAFNRLNTTDSKYKYTNKICYILYIRLYFYFTS